jgi:hypothetical protein
MCSIHKEVGAAISTIVFLLLVPSCHPETTSSDIAFNEFYVFDVVHIATFSKFIYVIDKIFSIE